MAPVALTALEVEDGMSFDHFDHEAIITSIAPINAAEMAMRYMIKKVDTYTCYQATVLNNHVFTIIR